jgi:hypothetical protein
VVATLEQALATKLAQDRFLATGAELVPQPVQNSKGFGEYSARNSRRREAATGSGVAC